MKDALTFALEFAALAFLGATIYAVWVLAAVLIYG